MEQLISQLASQFGIDEALAHKAVGMVLSLLQNQGDSGAVSELFEKLPGAGDLAEEYAGGSGGGGGGLGSMLGGLMGGGAGEAMKLVGALQSDGLSMDQIKGIGTGLLDHAKQEGGEDLVRRAVEGIPGVSDYI